MLNVTVYRALEIPKIPEFPEAEFGLAPGTPFLVDDDDLNVLEGPLLYLLHRFPHILRMRPQGRRQASPHTVDAAAFDLAHFIQCVEEADGIRGDWAKVTDGFVHKYCDYLLQEISPRTQQTLAPDTVYRRASRGLDYCYWRKVRGLTVAVENFDVAFYRDAETENESFIPRASPRFEESETSLPYGKRRQATKTRAAEPVTILEPAQWATLKEELGPLPSERNTTDDRTSRDRIAAELSLNSGMRVDEIAKLTIYQLLDLKVDPSMASDELVELRITRTKGLRPRSVTVPVYLVRELHQYIAEERKLCLEEAKKYWLHGKVRAPKTLLLNSVSARNHAGKAVTPGTLSARFHEAVMRCAFVRSIEILVPKGVDQVDVDEGVASLFVFHSLRHSYAVWLYWAEKAAGNSEPWKLIQTRLGHRFLSTTMNTYLRFTDVERRHVNRVTFDATRRRYSGD